MRRRKVTVGYHVAVEARHGARCALEGTAARTRARAATSISRASPSNSFVPRRLGKADQGPFPPTLRPRVLACSFEDRELSDGEPSVSELEPCRDSAAPDPGTATGRVDQRRAARSLPASFIAEADDAHRLQRPYRTGERRGLAPSRRQSGSRPQRSPVGRSSQRDRIVER